MIDKIMEKLLARSLQKPSLRDFLNAKTLACLITTYHNMPITLNYVIVFGITDTKKTKLKVGAWNCISIAAQYRPDPFTSKNMTNTQNDGQG